EKLKEIKVFPGTYTMALNNLGNLYITEKKYLTAGPLILERLEVKKHYFGENRVNYAATLGSLSLLYSNLNQIDKAETTYLKTVAILEALSYTQSEYYKINIDNLALLYINNQSFHKASLLLIKSAHRDHVNFVEALKFLSQEELNQYKKTNLNTHYSQLSFINDYHLNDSVILANYKNEILLKNMSLKNQQGIKNSI